jgi:hypothetical protein
LSDRAKSTALVAILYAGYAAMLVLSLVLFVTIVFFLVPPLTTGSTPTRQIAGHTPVPLKDAADFDVGSGRRRASGASCGGPGVPDRRPASDCL